MGNVTFVVNAQADARDSLWKGPQPGNAAGWIK